MWVFVMAELQVTYVDRASVDELFAAPVGVVELHAKRYGAEGRVLALVRAKGVSHAAYT